MLLNYKNDRFIINKIFDFFILFNFNNYIINNDIN